MFCAAAKHVAEGGITSMAWIWVLTGAASVGGVKVTAIGPTVVQIVVVASSPGRHGSTLVVLAIVGACCCCWGWLCCHVLRSKDLGGANVPMPGMSGIMAGLVIVLGSEAVSETAGGVMMLCWSCSIMREKCLSLVWLAT